jgi:uncharacterized membrane protein
MLVLPLVLLVLGLALALLKAGALRPQNDADIVARRRGLLAGGVEGRLRLFLYALATGSLFVANTWDYPTYLGITLLCLALPMLGTPAARWAQAVVSRQSAVGSDEELKENTQPATRNPQPDDTRQLKSTAEVGDEDDIGELPASQSAIRNPQSAIRTWLAAWRDTRLGSWVTQAVALVALGLLLFLPFHLTFKSLVGGTDIPIPESVQKIPLIGALASKLAAFIGVNVWTKTWEGFITIFGFFLYALLAWMAVLLVRNLLAARDAGVAANRTALITLGGVVGVSLVGSVLFRFPLLALLPPAAALAAYLIYERLQPGRWASEELFALLLIGMGAVITFGTEIFFLQDVFHSRLNTLFKFYYQVWIIWGAMAGFALWWLLSWAFSPRGVPGSAPAGAGSRTLVGAWAAGFAGLFVLSLVYAALAPEQRDNGIIWVPGIQLEGAENHKIRGLNGIADLAISAPGDLAVIEWLRTHARAGDGIAEQAFAIEYNVRGQHGRVSSYTGMPGILVWQGHEYQWRGGQPQIMAQFAQRLADQTTLYTTTDVKTAKAILQKYGIHYVFVGTIEKGEQGLPDGDQPNWPPSPQALGKFAQFMTLAYSQGGTQVYYMPDSAVPGNLGPNAGGNSGPQP